MKNLFKHILILTLCLNFYGCGYKVYNDNTNYKFEKIDIVGNKLIGRKIQNILNTQTTNGKLSVFATINVKENNFEKDKNKSGKITSYNLEIIADVAVNSQSKSVSEQIQKISSYDVGTYYTDTITNQKRTREYLISQIVNEIKSLVENEFGNVN